MGYRTTIAAIAVLAAGTTGAAAAQSAPPAGSLIAGTETTLDVVAEGRSTRVPDLATIRAGVVTQAPTAAAALGDNAGRMAQVLAVLRRAGIAARDITTTSVALQPQYRYAENQPPAVTGYQATNSVAVRFRDIGRAGAILDSLVAQGANQIDGPDLAIENPDAALDEARADAVKRARARADLYARAAGLGVGRIVSILEGARDAGDPPVRPMLRAVAADARTEVAAGAKQVTATVTVRFVLR